MTLSVVCRGGQCLAIGAGSADRGVAWQDFIFSAGNRAKTRARLGQTAAAPPPCRTLASAFWAQRAEITYTPPLALTPGPVLPLPICPAHETGNRQTNPSKE